MTQGVLLDAASHLTWSIASELNDMEGIEDAGGVLGAVQAMAFLLSPPLEGSRVAICIPERNCSPRSANQFSCVVPDLPGTRSNKRAVG